MEGREELTEFWSSRKLLSLVLQHLGGTYYPRV
jgi:hypothetical protein